MTKVYVVERVNFMTGTYNRIGIFDRLDKANKRFDAEVTAEKNNTQIGIYLSEVRLNEVMNNNVIRNWSYGKEASE